MNDLTLSNNESLTMSSREIAELLGKQHWHIKRDVLSVFDVKNVGNREFVHCGNTYTELLLSEKQQELFIAKKKYGSVAFGLKEFVAMSTIEQLLGLKLDRQFPVGKYRVDGYHRETNTVYEIDESHHKYNLDSDLERQCFIENELGCSFVRIKV